MPGKPKYSSNLHSSRQSTGGRPLIVLCLVSLLLLTFYLREGDTGMIHFLRGAAVTITSPVRMLGGAVAAPFNASATRSATPGASSETLSELKKENERLTAKVAELSEAQETAARLEKLVGLQSTYSLKSTAARIIGSTGDAWSNAVIIDKGANAGFEVGMPVCSSGGVIGQIIEVSATTSTVRLVSDEQSGISAMVQGSRAQGMLCGQADGTLRLEYVVSDAEVSARRHHHHVWYRRIVPQGAAARYRRLNQPCRERGVLHDRRTSRLHGREQRGGPRHYFARG